MSGMENPMPEKQNHDWPRIVEEWKQSGLSQEAFCKSQNLSVWSLRDHCKTRNKKRAANPQAMVEIATMLNVGPASEPASMRIIFPNRIVVESKLSGTGRELETLLRLINSL